MSSSTVLFSSNQLHLNSGGVLSSPQTSQISPVPSPKTSWDPFSPSLPASSSSLLHLDGYHHSLHRCFQLQFCRILTRHHLDSEFNFTSCNPQQQQQPPNSDLMANANHHPTSFLNLEKNLDDDNVAACDFEFESSTPDTAAYDYGLSSFVAPVDFDDKLDYVLRANELQAHLTKSKRSLRQKQKVKDSVSALIIPSAHLVPAVPLTPLGANNGTVGVAIGPSSGLGLLSSEVSLADETAATSASCSSSIPTPKELVCTDQLGDYHRTEETFLTPAPLPVPNPVPNMAGMMHSPGFSKCGSVASLSGYGSDDDDEDDNHSRSNCNIIESLPKSATQVSQNHSNLKQQTSSSNLSKVTGKRIKKVKHSKKIEERIQAAPSSQTRSEKKPSKSKQENPKKRTHNYAKNPCGFVEDSTRQWVTLPLPSTWASKVPDFDVKITCRTRMDTPIHSIPDRLYTNMNYTFLFSATGVTSIVIAQLSIVSKDSLEPVAGTKILGENPAATKCPLFSDRDQKPSTQRGAANGSISVKFNKEHDWHTGRPQFCWLISFYLGDNPEHVVLRKCSPPFSLYARKPNKRVRADDSIAEGESNKVGPDDADNDGDVTDGSDKKADEDPQRGTPRQHSTAPTSASTPTLARADNVQNLCALSDLFQHKLEELLKEIAGYPREVQHELVSTAWARLCQFKQSAGDPPAAAHGNSCSSPAINFLHSPL